MYYVSDWIRKKLRTAPKHLFLVDVCGDSMEPTLSDGGTVLVDTDKRQLKADGIYVFRNDGELFVKRVERQVGGLVMIRSDNTRYEPYLFDPDKDGNKIFGRVVWYARTLI